MPDAPNKEPIAPGMLQRVLNSLRGRNSNEPAPRPASGGDEGDGRNAPRDAAAHTQGHRHVTDIRSGSPITWFDAGKPGSPQAPDSVAGRAFDYPVGYNLSTRPRQYESISFEQLRRLADNYDILRTVIETRKDQMAKLTWSILPKKKANQKIRPQSDDVCEKLENFLAYPDKENPWQDWLRMLMEDLLVLDAPAIYVRRSRSGGVWGLEVVDGSTIKRVLSEDGRTPVAPDPAYQQILQGMSAVDYTLEEMIYSPRNKRPHKVYGFSPTEQVVMTVNIGIRRQINQLQYFTEGNVPEALVSVPETWTPDQIRIFQDYWDSLMEGDTAARRHMKFVPGGLNVQFTREPQLKDQYDEWIARVIAYAFSVPALPFVREVNRATAETAVDTAMNEGLAPLMVWVKSLMDRIISQVLKVDGVEFIWDDVKELDAKEKADLDSTYIRMGLKSIDDARAELGQEPMGIGPMLLGVGPGGFIMLEDLKDPEKRAAMTNPMGAMGGAPGGAPGGPAPGGAPGADLLSALGAGALGPTPEEAAVSAQPKPVLPEDISALISANKMAKRGPDRDEDDYP